MLYRHIAFYKFVSLAELPELRDLFLRKLREQQIFGTILLAQEGLNGGLSGTPEAILAFESFLRADPRFHDIVLKENRTASPPYQRRIVKIRQEIVTMGVDRTALKHDSPRISPKELQTWIQEGRDFVLLDTRNDYEYQLGSFEKAEAAGINHFRHFPKKAEEFPAAWRKRPVVSFCTGGIRCEKAAPYLESLGFEKVYQLDGGILRYFQEVGGDHWQGDCFVFDERVAVGPDLLASGAAICPQCQKVLDKKYAGHCPDCAA